MSPGLPVCWLLELMGLSDLALVELLVEALMDAVPLTADEAGFVIGDLAF